MTITITSLSDVRDARQTETANDIAAYVERALGRLPEDPDAVAEVLIEHDCRGDQSTGGNPVAKFVASLPLLGWNYVCRAYSDKVFVYTNRHQIEITLPGGAAKFLKAFMDEGQHTFLIDR